VVAAVVTPWALVVPVGYLVSLALVALTTSDHPLLERMMMAMALAVIHISWGSGFLASFAFGPRLARRQPASGA